MRRPASSSCTPTTRGATFGLTQMWYLCWNIWRAQQSLGCQKNGSRYSQNLYQGKMATILTTIGSHKPFFLGKDLFWCWKLTPDLDRRPKGVFYRPKGVFSRPVRMRPGRPKPSGTFFGNWSFFDDFKGTVPDRPKPSGECLGVRTFHTGL